MQTLEHTYQEPMNKLIIERSADSQLLEDPTGDLHPSGLHADIGLHQMRHDLLYGLQILCIVDEFPRVLVNDSNHIVGNARHQKPHFFAPIRFIIQYRRHKVAVKLCQLLGVCDEKRKNLESVAHHIRYVALNYHTQRGDKQGLH